MEEPQITACAENFGDATHHNLAIRRIPRTIWILGLVSLLTDMSSEIIHSLLPVFLISALGASATVLGAIEGIAEAAASITKVFSGVLTDWYCRRKPLVVIGYTLAAVSKPLFPLAGTVGWVFAARFVDRIGKGIRGAPRDALVADVAPITMRGTAYGLRQALDTLGAFLAPLIAILLMSLLANDVRAVFWIAVLPAWIGVALLIVGVAEPARHVEEVLQYARPHFRDLRQLGAPYWSVVSIALLFTLARFSEAFLVLRVHDVGVSLAWTPLALVVMNCTYVASAFPVGRLADRIDRIWLLSAGFAALIAADLTLALARQPIVVLLGIAIWGLHMGLTQGVLAAMVADAASVALRGSAFGVFHFGCGVATFLASLLAGILWQTVGPSFTFLSGAAFSAAALAGIVVWKACLR